MYVMLMGIKLTVTRKLAEYAIKEKINELKQSKELNYSGCLSKLIGNRTHVLYIVSNEIIQVKKENLPLNEFFVFEGWAKLSYQTTEEDDFDIYEDGSSYEIHGSAQLIDDDGYLEVILYNNTLEITNIKK